MKKIITIIIMALTFSIQLQAQTIWQVKDGYITTEISSNIAPVKSAENLNNFLLNQVGYVSSRKGAGFCETILKTETLEKDNFVETKATFSITTTYSRQQVTAKMIILSVDVTEIRNNKQYQYNPADYYPVNGIFNQSAMHISNEMAQKTFERLKEKINYYTAAINREFNKKKSY